MQLHRDPPLLLETGRTPTVTVGIAGQHTLDVTTAEHVDDAQRNLFGSTDNSDQDSSERSNLEPEPEQLTAPQLATNT